MSIGIKYFIKHFLSAKRKGHGIHSPFAYQLCEEVFYNKNSFYEFEKLKKIRAQLLQNEQIIEVEDLGAGSRAFIGNKRKIKDIALKGISPEEQSQIFYKLINFLNANTIVELGTSLGLNTLYLASANQKGRVYSIEGSKGLSDFASQLAKKNKIQNIEFIKGNFDKTFPELLEKINALDLLYVDGNHTYSGTINYFKLALEKKHNSSVFIFDDIYWSKEMIRAWEEIKKHPAVTLSIDVFYFGMVFFREEVKEKTDLRLYL